MKKLKSLYYDYLEVELLRDKGLKIINHLFGLSLLVWIIIFVLNLF